jgi:hypothetical protein
MKTHLIAIAIVALPIRLFSAEDGLITGSLEDRVAAKELSLRALHHQIEIWKKNKAILRDHNIIQLKDAEARLTKRQDEIVQAQSELDDLAGAIVDLKQTFADYKKSFYSSERANAVDDKIAILNTKDGRVYKQVIIKRFDPQGIVIMHQVGMRNVHFTLLPDELQQRFNFDPEEAIAFTKQDEARRKKFKAADEARLKRELAAKILKNKEDRATGEGEAAQVWEKVDRGGASHSMSIRGSAMNYVQSQNITIFKYRDEERNTRYFALVGRYGLSVSVTVGAQIGTFRYGGPSSSGTTTRYSNYRGNVYQSYIKLSGRKSHKKIHKKLLTGPVYAQKGQVLYRKSQYKPEVVVNSHNRNVELQETPNRHEDEQLAAKEERLNKEQQLVDEIRDAIESASTDINSEGGHVGYSFGALKAPISNSTFQNLESTWQNCKDEASRLRQNSQLRPVGTYDFVIPSDIDFKLNELRRLHYSR